MPGLRDLENHHAAVSPRRSSPNKVLLQERLRQAARRAFLQVKVRTQIGHGHGSGLDEGLERIALAYGKLITARPVPVSKLKDPDELVKGFLNPRRVPHDVASAEWIGGVGHGFAQVEESSWEY